MPRHTLTWFSNRTTPLVTNVGEGTAKKRRKSYGKIVKQRRARQSEEKTIRRGGWVTTRQSAQAKNKKSRLRPALARKQKRRGKPRKSWKSRGRKK